MAKSYLIPICKLEEAERDVASAISDIIREYEHAQQRRRVDKVLGPSGLPIESIMTAQSIFAKEIPIRSAYAHRKRSMLTNSRFGAYGLPYAVMEYLYKRRNAIAELFGAPVLAVADVRFRYDHERGPYTSPILNALRERGK